MSVNIVDESYGVDVDVFDVEDDDNCDEVLSTAYGFATL